MDTVSKLMRHLSILVISLGLTATAWASEEPKQPAPVTQVASMVASPNACKLEPLDEICEMNFHIIWESPYQGDFCLFEDHDDEPLSCWQLSSRGSVELEFSGHILEEYKMYQLQDSTSKVTITTVTVPISGTLKQRQRAQRRRRGFWRMF